MRSKLKIYAMVLPGLFWVQATNAQFKFEKAVNINKENGLPTNGVRSMAKGPDGFIWLATSEGLCRFDGLQIKVFNAGNDLSYSLFDQSVFSVLPLKDEVWAGTSQGISVLNLKDNTFRHYQLNNSGKTDSLKRRYDQQVSVLYQDKTGRIWLGTADRGVAVYDKSKDDFRFFSFPADKFPPLLPSLGSGLSILNIKESVTNDSIIYAGTLSGLQQINKYSGETILYTYPQESKDYQVALNAFRRLYHHDDGLLYVGSWAAGVNVFDPVKKTFTPLEVKSADRKKMVTNVIGNIARKNEHEIWIYSITGLAVYDTKLKDVTWYKMNNPRDKEYYAVNFIDEANRVWYYDNFGLSVFDPAIQQFSSYSFKHLSKPDWAYVFYVLYDSSGNHITVCPRITDGVYFFDKQTKEWKKKNFPGNRQFIGERESVRGFIQLSPGEYIITTDHAFYRYSENKGTITVVNPGPQFLPARRGEIIKDRRGNVWFSDDTWGLTRWNPESGKYINYKNQTPPQDNSIAINRLINLYEDSRGNIWFQQVGGLGVYVAARDSIYNFIFSKNETNSFPAGRAFAEDKKGRVWVNGRDGWIGYAMSADPAAGIVYKMNMRGHGISGDFNSMATDPNGDVWGHTWKELVKINADDLSLSTYSFKYGAGDADFYHFSFLPSGEMIFGGRNDITLAHPSELKRNAEIPVPYISEIQVLNQPFHFIMNGQKLKLRYRQNFFSIGFSAIAYTMAKDVKFRYRLKGFDDWSEPTSRHFANYTNVPGGDYVFQLQAANNEGIWNEQFLELPVWVNTPFWLRWWFRISVVLAIVFIIWSVYRYRAAQYRKKQQLKSEYEKKLANVEMSALLAQMNPHFLFNSLNSIDSYIIRNESKKASEYLNNFARLMRLILQNSRSNYISLKDELEALDLYLQMESLRFKDKFSYSISVDENLDAGSIVIPPMLIQPYVENAIWHGLMHKSNGESGKVELRVSKRGDELVCMIQDNGIGRKKAAEMKANKQSSHKRSMGMQITEDRIEIINKLYNMNAAVHIYDLENEKGESKGTKVELTIPV